MSKRVGSVFLNFQGLPLALPREHKEHKGHKEHKEYKVDQDTRLVVYCKGVQSVAQHETLWRVAPYTAIDLCSFCSLGGVGRHVRLKI